MNGRKQTRKTQAGFVVLAELVLIVSIVVIGSIVGLVAIRDSWVAEMHDMAESVGRIDQSYEYPGIMDAGTGTTINGSNFTDGPDNIATAPGRAGLAGDETTVDFRDNTDSINE